MFYLISSWECRISQRRLQRARELRQILCHLGPSFVKVGQSLSVGLDICPQEYLDEFSGLQVKVSHAVHSCNL
ncbi:uncharacterized protein [Physcomitrium patens]|uniref:uncharacterized protein n=1 Tax=Physcomitrium patens TaxID=3218 RepID=UPI003CCD9DB5